MLVEHVENVLADFREFALNLLPVALDHLDLNLIALRLLLLFDRRNDPPRCTTRTNDILIRNGKEVTLLNGELLVRRGHALHVLDHLCIRVVSHECHSRVEE